MYLYNRHTYSDKIKIFHIIFCLTFFIEYLKSKMEKKNLNTWQVVIGKIYFKTQKIA